MKTQSQSDSPSWKDNARTYARQAGREARDAIDNPFFGFIAWVLAIGLGVALIRVALTNIEPYYSLFASAGAEAPWVKNLPVLGWMLTTWNNVIASVGAILVWSVVQIFQVLWILILLDRKAKRGALKDARKNGVNPDDFSDRRSRRIARGVNGIPFFFIRWSALLALFAYAFDFAIGIHKYPPARNLQVFFVAIASGITSRIDWGNLTKLLTMMFSFELLLIPFVIVIFWIRARQFDSAN
ncbi:hypothetical protein [Leptolyngbya sp. NIES-2104]|uniref:hypothetical protein n=1 Tax=Leptolyngbya sp. NIES-2104 TaxID=1552121 RepID=UPI0006ECA0E9|nr:hypothetical protein [Leptolyngbya sp. NIES-2104]GAQ00122.1 hypothetical protein NIES2104_66870 [Leptolyngbya sp. NIES-2104]